MSEISSRNQSGEAGKLRPHRMGPTAATFVVVAVGIYLTTYLAIGMLQHVVMPVLAILVAAYLARIVYRHTGGRSPAA